MYASFLVGMAAIIFSLAYQYVRVKRRFSGIDKAIPKS
jgi:hypothetical protein